MLWLLKDHFELDVSNMDGEESTGVFVLQRLAKEREDIALYLRLRELRKLVSAFYETYRKLAYKGKIYTTFHSTKTRTGRLSSSDPNIQQVPDAVRPLIRPRSPNHVFINYDLSAIEAKLIASESGDLTLIDLIQRGLSPHDQNAKIFFNLKCPVEQVKKNHPVERQVAKTAGFALFYGAGKNRLKTVFVSNNIHVEDEEIAAILKRFKKTYAGSFRRHKEITEALSHQQLFNLFGRPIIVEDPEDYYMKGYNTMIQSSASDLNLIAAMRAQERFDNLKDPPGILALVHDSILVECHKDYAQLAERILVEELKRFKLRNDDVGVTIPIECEGGIIERWK